MQPEVTVTHTLLPIVATVVDSSQIESIGHDAPSKTLAVVFRKKSGPGSLYYYDGVPENVYNDFLKAESKGKFFGAHIKGAYACRKYEPATEAEKA